MCGGRGTCTLQINKAMGGRSQYVVQTSCQFWRTGTRWQAMARPSIRSPSTNRPLPCPACTKPVWTYGMAAHYTDEHPSLTGLLPAMAIVPESEKSAVLAWMPHNSLRKKRPRAPSPPDSPPATAEAAPPSQGPATSSSPSSEVTDGDTPRRPLDAVGARARVPCPSLTPLPRSINTCVSRRLPLFPLVSHHLPLLPFHVPSTPAYLDDYPSSPLSLTTSTPQTPSPHRSV